MLAQTNWTGKEDFHRSERRAVWVYNEVCHRTVFDKTSLPPGVKFAPRGELDFNNMSLPQGEVCLDG
jgi:hypothetical protein